MRFARIVLVVTLVVSTPAPALGWANGTGGCDSFGTHDWIPRFRRSTVLAGAACALGRQQPILLVRSVKPARATSLDTVDE